jgi:hypothetical protein
VESCRKKRGRLTVEDGLQPHQAKLLVGKYALAHFGYVENTLHGSKLKNNFGMAKYFAFFAKLAAMMRVPAHIAPRKDTRLSFETPSLLGLQPIFNC